MTPERTHCASCGLIYLPAASGACPRCGAVAAAPALYAPREPEASRQAPAVVWVIVGILSLSGLAALGWKVARSRPALWGPAVAKTESRIVREIGRENIEAASVRTMQGERYAYTLELPATGTWNRVSSARVRAWMTPHSSALPAELEAAALVRADVDAFFMLVVVPAHPLAAPTTRDFRRALEAAPTKGAWERSGFDFEIIGDQIFNGRHGVGHLFRVRLSSTTEIYEGFIGVFLKGSTATMLQAYAIAGHFPAVRDDLEAAIKSFQPP
jgi:hypothetical protein